MSNKNHQLDKARFDQSLRKNFDYGEGFYQNMQDYKSVADFLKKRKKKKKPKSAKIELLKRLLKYSIDFPIDDSFNDPITPEESSSIEVALPFGGITDEYTTVNDQEDKTVDNLNFGRDYQNDRKDPDISAEMNKIINPGPSALLGLPDGMDPEELDADKTLSKTPVGYGTTESGNQTFEGISFA